MLKDTVRTARLGIAVLAVLTLAQYIAGLSVPWLSGRLTTALLDNDTAGQAVPDLLFAGLALALVTQAALAMANIRCSAGMQLRLTAAMQVRVYAHLQSLPLAFHHQRRTGALLSLLSHDAPQVAGFVATAIGPALPHVLTFLVAMGLMMTIDWRLGAAAGAAVPLFFLASRLFLRKLRPLSTQLSESYGEASAHAESHLSAMLLMKAFNRGGASSSDYSDKVRRVSELAQRVAMGLGRIQPGLSLIAGLLAVAVVWMMSSRLATGTLRPGELVSFLMYGYFLARPMSHLSAMYGQLQHARASAGRLCEVLDIAQEPGGDAGRRLTDVRGEIEFRDVRFAYPNRPPALDGVSLHIRTGETVALIGENGAGKTTLAHLLLRFAEPDGGRILLDGENLDAIEVTNLRGHIGLVPQSALLIDGSVAENIAFGRNGVMPERIESAAGLAQAHEFITELPEGYNTRVGERGVKLSGGQQQRIALARALLNDPPVLILDEATAQLDPQSEANFLESLADALSERTVLLITHRPTALTVADRVVELDKGRIVSERPATRRVRLA